MPFLEYLRSCFWFSPLSSWWQRLPWRSMRSFDSQRGPCCLACQCELRLVPLRSGGRLVGGSGLRSGLKGVRGLLGVLGFPSGVRRTQSTPRAKHADDISRIISEKSFFDFFPYILFSYFCGMLSKAGWYPFELFLVFAFVFVVATLTMEVNAVFRLST